MYGFLRRPRWIALLLLVAVLVVAFVQLAAWQDRRHYERAARNAVIEANADAATVPLATVLAPSAPVDSDVEWRQVTVEGRWDADGQVLVRNRPREGRPGYLVVTPLVPDAAPALLVVRGWVPVGATAVDQPDVPEPTAGDVTAVVRLRRAEEPKSAGDLPTGHVLRVDPELISTGLGYPVYDGYGELVSQVPEPAAPLPLPAEPTLSAGPHLGYAVQWVLFACVAIGGVIALVRREAEYLREEREHPDGAAQTDAEISSGSA